jgi:hypothetical protein
MYLAKTKYIKIMVTKFAKLGQILVYKKNPSGFSRLKLLTLIMDKFGVEPDLQHALYSRWALRVAKHPCMPGMPRFYATAVAIRWSIAHGLRCSSTVCLLVMRLIVDYPTSSMA